MALRGGTFHPGASAGRGVLFRDELPQNWSHYFPARGWQQF